jgi:hypothetical protein
MGLILIPGGADEPEAQAAAPEPEAEREPEPMPDRNGYMIPVLTMVCPRCHAQAAMEVRPMALFLRNDGVLVADVKDESEIQGQAFVVGMPSPQAKCPNCGSGGIIVPSGGLPPNLKI